MKMSAAQAKAIGTIDGISEVNDVLREQGAATVIATLRPGHLGWDEGAINNAAHRFRGVPEKLAKTYYRAYEKAAVSRAKQIRSQHEVGKRR